MAEYNMQELNLPGEDGKRILYPRMKLYGQVDLETITEKIAYASSFTRGDIIGLVQAITDEIAYQMGQGYSVKIDNLGVFTPALGLRQERLERAKKYLEKNSFMTQADYCQLTGLLKSAASRELREWIANP